MNVKCDEKTISRYDDLPSTSQPQKSVKPLQQELKHEPSLATAPRYAQSGFIEQQYVGHTQTPNCQYSLQQQNLLQGQGEQEREPSLPTAPEYMLSSFIEQQYVGHNSLQQLYTCQQPLSDQSQFSMFYDNQRFDQQYMSSLQLNQQQPRSAMQHSSGVSQSEKKISGKGRRFPSDGTMSGKDNGSPSELNSEKAYLRRKQTLEVLDAVEELKVKVIETLRDPEEEEKPTLSQRKQARHQNKNFSQLGTGASFKESKSGETFSKAKSGLSYEDYFNATNGFEKSLGKGGEGEVFEGTLNGLKIAVKRIEKSTSFKREEKMVKCRDPFILPVWDVIESLNTALPHLVVYPVMSNGNLYDAIVKKKKNISFKKRITIALNIVHSLKYLHSNGFVYRDFKSSNILLDDYMNPRLGDYGVVKQLFPKDDTASKTGGTTTTKLSAIKATEGYLCPIYRTSREAVPENDLWGLGVVLLELLVGKSGSSSDGRPLPTRMVKYQSLCNPRDAVNEILEKEKYVRWMKEQGWPDPNEQSVTVKFLELAFRCLHTADLKKRIPLDELSRQLKALARKADWTPFFNEPANLDNAICVYCLRKRRSNHSMLCGHVVACRDCPGKSESLVCPHCCEEHYLRFGNPSSCALIISGRGNDKPVDGVQPDMLVFRNDAEEVANLLKNKLNFREERVHLITPDTSQSKTSVETIDVTIDLLQLQFDEARKKSKTSVVEVNLFVFISGHFDKQGNFETKAGEKLFGNDFLDKLKELKADNILMFLMGCYSEGFFDGNRQKVHRSQTMPANLNAQIPSDVEEDLNVMGRLRQRLRRTVSSVFSSTNNSESAQASVADESPNKTVTKHIDIALKNLVAYCSSPAEGTSFFKSPIKGNKQRVDTSIFTTFLINGLSGAQECGSLYNEGVDGKIDASSCYKCFALRQRLSQLKVVEVNDIVNYIRDHMKPYVKEERFLPRLLVSGDGRKIYLLFAIEEGRI